MTWRVPPFDAAVDELVAYVRATYAPLGIIVAGSIVRGEAGPTSDLDVFSVHDQPWRMREQKRFSGVPAELFLNPAAQVRRYFASEHAEGRPCTAHMFATGEVVKAHPIVDDLVREAREWLARPLEVTEASLVQRRYGIVDTLDDVRDVIDHDPPAAALLIADAVRGIIVYAFWKRRLFQPRRKAAVSALETIDADAAALVRRWQSSNVPDGWRAVEDLARHVIEVDTFFEWVSERDSAAE
jgi:predicted nucleotidyltransferase